MALKKSQLYTSLWQSCDELRGGILSRWQPVLAFLPVETVIKRRQADYYRLLGEADQAGDCSGFIGFLLDAIFDALKQAIDASLTGAKGQLTPVETPVEAGTKTPERNLANELLDAGYTAEQAQALKDEVSHFEDVRSEVKLASGDYVDMKLYEPAMRHLLDTYIRAEESEKVSAFDDLTLVKLIVEHGETAVDELPKGLREDQRAMAETIENNVRRLIIDEMAVNPKYYERMSQLLDALIAQRKQEAIDYAAYLAKVVELTRKVSRPGSGSAYPLSINSPLRCALYDNLLAIDNLSDQLASRHRVADVPDIAAAAALAVDDAIRAVRKADWRGNRFKEREVLNAVRSVIDDAELAEQVFSIVRAQRDG